MKFTPRKLILVTSLMVMASSLMATDSLATTAPQSQPQITSCPTEFFVVKIHEDARQCQPSGVSSVTWPELLWAIQCSIVTNSEQIMALQTPVQLQRTRI